MGRKEYHAQKRGDKRLLMFGPMVIRPANQGDYPLFARLFPELRVPDPVPSRARFETEMMATTLIVERDGAGVGVAFFQVLETMGYVRTLIAAPEARRTGVGRALMAHLRDPFRAIGCTRWCLNVLRTNGAAIGLYASFGLRRAYLSSMVDVPWKLLDDRPCLHAARPIDPADDARIEHALDILPGRITDTRRRGPYVYRMIDGPGPGEIGAAAIFDPAFPGAYPFKARSPELAIALLHALRPHARPTDDAVSVVIEDQPAIADALVALGATVRLETMHMRAPL